ncbi:MAG TPA: UDP-N-acetylmuramate--L-alanine ligase [Syntrophomonadaceae bacterium]|nr:UDP-N-acetylmuramate--L-alanine ligase [Syntrophomonadaceae bacterium]
MATKLGQWVHMVGIAGAGMSGIAHILSEQGVKVSGSDLQTSNITKNLESLGIEIYQGHSSSHIKEGVDLLVISSAIPPDNVEVLEARQRNIPVIKRGKMLANLVNDQKSIAIAGAHGKTTTTSMLYIILAESGIDPTFIVGGEFQNSNLNAKLGSSDYFVVEADESDASFLDIKPYIGVITNIENDHLDYYKSFNNIKSAFRLFIDGVRDDGFTLVYGGDQCIREIISPEDEGILFYGESSDCDYYMENWQAKGLGSVFEVYHQKDNLGVIEISVPGKHNALNALASISIALELGVDFADIKKAIIKFYGSKRRFEIVGKVDNITIVDDYAHHPTEIEVTISAAQSFHKGRVVAVFQPHRFSRTKSLGKELGEAFIDADLVVFTEVYAAGEKSIPGISGKTVFEAAKKAGCNAVYIPELDEISGFLITNKENHDLIITMGAGDIWRVGQDVLRTVPNLNIKAHS